MRPYSTFVKPVPIWTMKSVKGSKKFLRTCPSDAKFSEQVLDATNDWQLVVREETKLKGLPSTAKEAARLTALEKLGEEEGKDAWVFTLHMPSMLPVLQYLDDEEIRQKVWAMSDRLCVDEPYANEPLIRQILALRQEKAEILGKDDFADVVLSRRMAVTEQKRTNS